jgi:hypothetical protein
VGELPKSSAVWEIGEYWIEKYIYLNRSVARVAFSSSARSVVVRSVCVSAFMLAFFY